MVLWMIIIPKCCSNVCFGVRQVEPFCYFCSCAYSQIDKVELVKDIIVRLSSALENTSYDSAELHITWKPLDISQYTAETQAPKLVSD